MSLDETCRPWVPTHRHVHPADPSELHLSCGFYRMSPGSTVGTPPGNHNDDHARKGGCVPWMSNPNWAVDSRWILIGTKLNFSNGADSSSGTRLTALYHSS
jgi:hypothetical protein